MLRHNAVYMRCVLRAQYKNTEAAEKNDNSIRRDRPCNACLPYLFQTQRNACISVYGDFA